MLTKGPITLFYCGDIEDLSERSPGRGVPILLMSSSIFQIFLYILKQSKSRKLKTYVQNLNMSLVENVLNMYGLIAIIIITTISVAYAFFHHSTFAKYKKHENTTDLVPKEIFFVYTVILFITIIPFIKSYALR